MTWMRPSYISCSPSYFEELNIKQIISDLTLSITDKYLFS